ncbi:phosphate acyltransferase PlsX [Peptoniphilus raoultii]|uniref:phosphate acyltransferase PlsX n=1 Tax=Peptoniphilus raoultii TaxID=1776387 RepID=UPI0008D96547|nr:phosphate acyltransferase PlsX [Peptoniphilus raoultii]
MKIIFDANGGDNPKEVIKGAIEASNEFNIDIILVGIKKDIESSLKEFEFNEKKVQIINAEEKIENEDDPAFALRKKKDSSIVVGLNLLKEKKADAFISAGSTGALLAGGIFIVGRIPGVKRAILPTYIPGMKKSTMIIDSGANMDSTEEFLYQFAQMGEVYLKEYYNVEDPKIALLNVGSEKGKGNALVKKTYEIFEDSDFNFIGNVEARDLAKTEADLVVCDGFVGNVLLKSIEGIAEFIVKSFAYKLQAEDLGPEMREKLSHLIMDMSKKLDSKSVGGTILLGLESPIIKAHGNSDHRAIKNASSYAIDILNKDIINKIKNKLGEK